MFIDEVILKIVAGNGGDGCTSFRREKYIPLGGPNGGSGGRGSNIIFKVDLGLKTLLDLRYMKQIKGKKGNNGLGSNRNGKNAADIIIKVPQGTTITDIDTNLILADLTRPNDEVIICHGGRGGRGNTAFATHNNTAPNFSENGEPGEERNVKVELKLLADVGFVGMPSVGKSTLLSKISASKPKIASYHFTTLSPNLGVVKTKDGRTFVAADLPGLIEGASLGHGLGDKFLKHIERTRVIVHILDMASTEGRNPHEDYVKIRKELEDFNPKLLKKPEIIVANKKDMESFMDNLKEFKNRVNKKVYEMSALTGDGIEEILIEIANLLEKEENNDLYEENEFESHVLYKFKKEQPFEIRKENDIFIVEGLYVEKLLKMTKFTDEGIRRFSTKLRKLGIDDRLKEMGVKEGDTIKILDSEFEYKE